MIICTSCGKSIPSVMSKCPECNHETGQVSYPEDPNWWDHEYVQRIVSQAESETVSTERLTAQTTGFFSRLLSQDRLEKRRSYDRPIIGYLLPDESPHYVFLANNYIVIRDRKESRYLRDERSTHGMIADSGYRPFVIVTDKRVLFILGDSDGDYLASAPISKIVDIEAIVSPPAHQEWFIEDTETVTSDVEFVFKLKLTTVDAKFEIYLHPETERSDVNSTVRFIEDLAVTSDQVKTLRGASGINHDDSSQTSKNANRANQTTNDIIDQSVLENIRINRESVDWNESIRAGLRVGGQALQYAKFVPYSTPITVGLATLTGTALKAHHTISGDSISIDPDELLDRGLANADIGSRFNMADFSSERVGASIGASRYMAERIMPVSYKHLVERTSPETIMKGAEAGIELGKRPESPLTSKQGAIAGASAGLVYSYVPQNSPLREVDPEQIFSNDGIKSLGEMLE